jgi:hypothetical protein
MLRGKHSISKFELLLYRIVKHNELVRRTNFTVRSDANMTLF